MPVYYDTVPGSKLPVRTGTARIAVTFGDFGVPVRVTAPPASQVYSEPGS